MPVGLLLRPLLALACLGLAAVVARPANTRYVWADSPTPTPPFLDWNIAARTIQEAVDVAREGDLILVTNGIYATGGRAVGTNLLVNRVAVEKPLRLLSVNGPTVTVIHGARAPDGGNGDGAVRCVFLGPGVTLSGFTLTGGATRTRGDWREDRAGGGARCSGTLSVITNCVLVGNSAENGGGVSWGVLFNCILTSNTAAQLGGAAQYSTLSNCVVTSNSAGGGGGIDGGRLFDCVVTGNSAVSGGGAADSSLSNCVLVANSSSQGGAAAGGWLEQCSLIGNSAERIAGGAYRSQLRNCTLTGNSAGDGGGGAYLSLLENCLLTGNTAGGPSARGGGSAFGTLRNCTLTGNSAAWGGGAFYGELFNCVVYFNTAVTGANHYLATVTHSCTLPLPEGAGNLAADPRFVNASGGDFRLRPDSPCINAGANPFARGSTDLAGNPRMMDGTVDLGAFEFDPTVPFITRFALTPAGLQIEWPATALGATLQRAASLRSPAWQDVPGMETVSTFTLPITQQREFFRLRQR